MMITPQQSTPTPAVDGALLGQHLGSPSPQEIRARRASAGLTQTAAAALIHSSKRTWQDWEGGIARMHPGLWELFLTKTAGTLSLRRSA